MELTNAEKKIYEWSLFQYSSIVKYLVLLILCLSSPVAKAVITIQNIVATESTCGNNGTAIIVATSSKSNPSLMYEIISGPATAPIQNNPAFTSLFPGTYTARIYDIDFLYKDQSFTVIGNYQLPDLLPKAINPTCTSSSDGRIIGNGSKGKAPYTWEMVSPFSGGPQSSDKFSNLASGSYSIKMTDACGNYQTRTVIIAGGGTGLGYWWNGIPMVYKFGCDSVQLTMQITMYASKAKFPLKLKVTTSNGVREKQILPIPRDTFNFNPGYYDVIDTIAGVTYGDYLSACLTDTCGYTLCGKTVTVSPFEFLLEYRTANSCGNKLAALAYLKNPPDYPGYLYTSYTTPITLTMRDIVLNTIVDSVTCTQNYCGALPIKELESGRNYQLKIVDGCGNVFQQNILWPVPLPPRFEYSYGPGCYDSTASGFFNFWNFKSIPTFELLSGPTVIGSTKRKYEFNDNITYPKSFSVASIGLALKNMAAGTYTYRVYDTCGNSLSNSFTIPESSVANFGYSYRIKKGCLGDNVLYFDASSLNTATVYIRKLGSPTPLYFKTGYIGPDSLTSLVPGSYELQIFYGYDPSYGGIGYDGSLADHLMDCWSLKDTIVIPPYSNNTFGSNTTISCNGTSYVELNVDSTRGVPPYMYEIASGPITYPLQNSSVFQLPTYGEYVIRIRDACGNSNTRQITVDSAKFPPIIKKGASCSGNRIVLKGVFSKFFSYEWRKPNGTTYIDDSLVIQALSAADTGVYVITKKVKINGCTDAFKSSYHIQLKDVIEQELQFCPGNSVHVGASVYTSPGVYRDTLKNELGCDSIVITTLKKFPQKSDTSHFLICKGNHITVGGKTYSMPGVYKDSVQNAKGCYDFKVTYLKVNGIPDTLKVARCIGENYNVGIKTYTATGVYTDTLTSSLGCDSILVTDLAITPYTEIPASKSICPGSSYTLGGKSYSQSGIYRDTLATLPCKSIVVLNLTVLSYKKDSTAHTICQGQTFALGGRTYNKTGIYRDTISTLSCDSISIVNLTVLPYKTNTISATICSGESYAVGSHTYYQSGVYKDTLPTLTCDSIVTLNLTVHAQQSQAIFFSNYVQHCFDEGPVTISTNWGKSFVWSPGGELTQTIVAAHPGVYTVSVTDNYDCIYTDQVNVGNHCEAKLFVPSAFSPNGDGLHDDLEIFGMNFTNFRITIFNRWGEIIFISTDRDKRWDGKYRGEDMPIGSYPYVVSYQSFYDSKEKKMDGSVTVIR